MSLLDDENILINDTKQSVNFVELLSDINESFRNHRTLHIDDINKLIPKLPRFEDYNWYVYNNTCIRLFCKSIPHTLCQIDFGCRPYTSNLFNNCSYQFFYGLILHEFADASQYEQEVIQNLKHLFDLDNREQWVVNYFRSWGNKINAHYTSLNVVTA